LPLIAFNREIGLIIHHTFVRIFWLYGGLLSLSNTFLQCYDEPRADWDQKAPARFHTLLKQKHEKEQIQVQYRNGAIDVLFLESKLFFIWQKCSFFGNKSWFVLEKVTFLTHFRYWTWIRTKKRTLFLRLYKNIQKAHKISS
jgi:hypothetical protein